MKTLSCICVTLTFGPKYIVRLDDACHTMDMSKWLAMEHILDKNNIKPIVAVIPNNQDHALYFGDKRQDFWNPVQSWEDKGWKIALQGYKHKYHQVDKKMIFPFYNQSEFAELCSLFTEFFHNLELRVAE